LVKFNKLKVLREKPAGLYLEVPRRGYCFQKDSFRKGRRLEIPSMYFYITTVRKAYRHHPKTLWEVDEVVMLKVVSVTSFGAFLDMGLMKD